MGFGFIYIVILFFLPPLWQMGGVVFLALYLFVKEVLPVDITALFVMILLMLLGLVTPAEGVSGFSSSATITVLCMFILSGAIVKTGVIQKLGQFIFKFTNKSLTAQILMISALAPLSAFFNNTAIVAIFLPMVIKMGENSKSATSKLLIPLSYLAMMGGTLTVIGTSTNILANDLLRQFSIPAFNIFDFSPIGLILLSVGILYFLTIGRLLLPDREIDGSDDWDRQHFVAELQIQEKSKLIDKTIHESADFFQQNEIKVLKLIRNDKSYIKGVNRQKLQAGIF